MNISEVVGYAEDDAIYCLDCFDGNRNSESVTPIFFEYCRDDHTCENCLEPIVEVF